MDLLAAYASDDEDSGTMNSDDYYSPQQSSEPVHSSKRSKLSTGQFNAGVHLPSAQDLLADLATPGTTITTAGAANQPSSPARKAPAKAQPVVWPQGHGTTQFSLPPEPARTRIFPHVDGNFATVVYIAVEAAAQAKLQAITTTLLTQCLAGTAAKATAGSTSSSGTKAPQSQQGTAQCASDKAAGIQVWPTFSWTSAQAFAPEPQQDATVPATDQQLPLHMSISRTVPIKRIQIESLQTALAKQLKPFKPCRVQLQGLSALVNDAKTRSFVGLRVAVGEKQVLRLIEAVNTAFIIHGLQPFYEDALPHVSLAWTPGDQANCLQQWLDAIPHDPVPLKVSQIVCQIGKVRHVVWQG